MTFKVVVQLYDKPDSSLINLLGNIMQIDNRYYRTLNFVYGTLQGNMIKDVLDLSFVEWIEEQSHLTSTDNNGNSYDTEKIDKTYEYLVVFGVFQPDYINQVLAIKGVNLIGNTVFIEEKGAYHYIVISSDPATAEEIKMLEFVIAVSPVDSVTTAPIPPPNVETTKAINMRLVIVGGVVAILVLAIAIAIYLAKRHKIHA